MKLLRSGQIVNALVFFCLGVLFMTYVLPHAAHCRMPNIITLLLILLLIRTRIILLIIASSMFEFTGFQFPLFICGWYV